MTAPSDTKDAPRAWWQILFFGLIVGLCLVLALTHQGMKKLTNPIEVWVDADTPAGSLIAATVHADRVIESAKLERRWDTGPLSGFGSQQLPYTGIVLIGSPAALQQVKRVSVRMDKRSDVFEQDRYQQEWTPWVGQFPQDTPPGWEARIFQTPLSHDKSIFALYDRSVNFEGDAALARYVLLSPVFVVYVLSFLLLLALRAFVTGRPIETAALTPTDAVDASMPQVAERPGWPWLLAGLAVLIAAGVSVERQYPYYFSEDDNFAQFLPNILYGCESLSAGEFPSWNPHQYLGAPLAEIGTYALTYPGTYFSYWFAAHVLDDRYATIEVFCCLHLLLGYLAMFWLGRCLGVAAPFAAAFALSQVLSGYALVAGRSWYYMTPVYLWVPLLLIALLHIRAQVPTLRWTLGTGLVIGIFFHAGNAQMWFYCMGLVALFVVWSCVNRSMPWIRLLQILPAGLIGLGVAAILLVPQFLATRDLQRRGGEGWDISEGALAVFAPNATPFVVDPANQQEDADPDRFGTMYHAGSIFTIGWLIVLLLVCARRGSLRGLLRNPWLGLALLCFLLALGDLAMVWTAQAYLPVLNQFNHPHKFLPFFHFFSCAVGAVFIDRAVRLSNWPRCWRLAIFGLIAGLLFFHASSSRSAFFLYAEHPYPDLPSELSGLKRDDVRILPLTFNRSISKDYVVGLQHNFPTVYGISSIGGYDPLIEQQAQYREVLGELQADPRPTIRKHGVTHLVLHKDVSDALKKRNWVSDAWRRLPPSFNGLVVGYDNEKPEMQTQSVRVFEFKDTTPIAYAVTKPSQALPVVMAPSRVDIDVSSLTTDQEVALNFLWRPGTRVYADGSVVPASADADRNIRTSVRAGTRQLQLRYESPWSTGFVVASVLVIAGLLGWFAMSIRSRTTNQIHGPASNV